MKESVEKVLAECVLRYGEVAQSCMAMEECAELIQAINKVLRKGVEDRRVLDNLVEEIADVTILIEQLKMIYLISDKDVENIIDKKIERQLLRFDKE